MQTITDNMRYPGIVHQANTALRLGRRGDVNGKNSAINRMYDTLEACQYPHLTASRLIREVGRGKALVLGLHRPLVDLALKYEG